MSKKKKQYKVEDKRELNRKALSAMLKDLEMLRETELENVNPRKLNKQIDALYDKVSVISSSCESYVIDEMKKEVDLFVGRFVKKD